MTHDEMIREKAWAMYCEETKDSPAAVDFPNQVPRAYWEELLIRAAERVIAPAVLEDVDRDLAMTCLANSEAPSEWIDGFEAAGQRVRAMITRYEQ